MKTYLRGKTSKEFKFAASSAGLTVIETGYQQGSDWLQFHGTLHGVSIDALFNTLNSRVIGTADGNHFSTDDNLDNTPWFDAVLELANVSD